jgi:2-polyprenyl-3-methyl-5-hydroxy-6-metoxy-1,4-benzoquinol methylase
MPTRFRSPSDMLTRGLRKVREYFQPQWRLARNRDWQRQSGLFQPWPFTRENRHPDFFDIVAKRLADADRPQILSFGCATGEEVLALARRVPHAKIDGVDINRACIAKAKRKVAAGEQKLLRFRIGDTVPDDGGPYDAIFCLSVLRHARLDVERPQSCADILPFERYLAIVERFDAALKPGGLLILWGANFLFTDTPIAARYRHIPVEGREGKCGAIYGPDNRIRPIDRHHFWVFEKLA